MEVIQNEAFDAVLMDLQMPGMDGYETAMAIRKLDGSEAQIKIFAMSADALGDVEKRVDEAKMDGYISKPFNPEELLDLLSKP
jgi:CheY-like chemotaxis protein